MNISNKKLLLTSLVGSRGAGIHTEESDYDYRGVYIEHTADVLRTDFKEKSNHKITGSSDDVYYEVGHFLKLALKCNPSIIEVFISEHLLCDLIYKKESDLLLSAFDYILDSKKIYNAYRGYMVSSLKKFDKPQTNHKTKRKIAADCLLKGYIAESLLYSKRASLMLIPEKRDFIKDVKFKGPVWKEEDLKVLIEGTIGNLEDAYTYSDEAGLSFEQNVDHVNFILVTLRRMNFDL